MRMTKRELTSEERRMIRAGLLNTALFSRGAGMNEQAAEYEALCAEIRECVSLRIFAEKKDGMNESGKRRKFILTSSMIEAARLLDTPDRNLTTDLQEDR